MAKIIKSWDTSCGAYSPYERDTLEFSVPAGSESPAEADPGRILEEARQEAERKVREAYAEGLRRGAEAGQAQFEESVGRAGEALQAAAAAMREAHEQFLASLEPQVVALAAAIAERILRREPSIDPERVRATTREALRHFEKRERIALRLNPADLKALKEQGVSLLEEFDGVEDLEIVADETIASGGCVAESDSLEVDARTETQFQQIVDGLMK